MPVTKPWLAGPCPSRALPREVREGRILNLLGSQNRCVLATAREEGPSATPVRYPSVGLDVMFTAAARSPKMRNRAADPRIDAEANPYSEAFRRQSDRVERSRSLREPLSDPLTIVTPQRIVFTEHWLRRDGFSPRQSGRV